MGFSACKIWPRERSKIVDILSVLFGLGAWIGINGIYTQLPLLVTSAPEGWQLPSIIVIVVQVSNVGVLAVWIIKAISGDPTAVSIYIYFVMTIGCASMLLLSFFHGYTAYIGDHLRSVPFMCLLFFISLGSCVSSVLYFPYMARFHEKYLVPYMVGEGLGGFLPGIISFAQGIGGNPDCVNGKPVYSPAHFGVGTFLQILFGCMIASLVAFILLDNLGCVLKGKSCSSHGTVYEEKFKSTSLVRDKITMDRGEGRPHGNSSAEIQETSRYDNNWTQAGDDISVSTESTIVNVPSRKKLASLLMLQAVLCMFSHAVLPAVQSYSCLPYGNTVYHLSINLASMANPMVCYLAFFLPHSSLRLISVLSGICIVSSTYILTTALMSPSPPLIASAAGGVIVVLCWVINSASVSYAKLSIATVVRSKGGRGLFLYGVTTQVGSAVGSLVIFSLVNFANVFEVYDPCGNS